MDSPFSVPTHQSFQILELYNGGTHQNFSEMSSGLKLLQVSSTVIMNQLVAFCSLKLVHTIVDCVLVLKLCEWEKEGSVFNSCLKDI
jgi:hypothetical protein